MPGEKILVVDDEEEILNLLEKKLLKENYKVLKAATAQDALQKAKKLSPQLILMDIALPDMEGPEAVRLLFEDSSTKDIPVIFLSGIITREEQLVRPEINVGGRLYPAIAKPFVFEELLGEIKNKLE